ncbi:MAG: hypothetical protein AAFS10_01315 [Myxococcota bacterium]
MRTETHARGHSPSPGTTNSTPPAVYGGHYGQSTPSSSPQPAQGSYPQSNQGGGYNPKPTQGSGHGPSATHSSGDPRPNLGSYPQTTQRGYPQSNPHQPTQDGGGRSAGPSYTSGASSTRHMALGPTRADTYSGSGPPGQFNAWEGRELQVVMSLLVAGFVGIAAVAYINIMGSTTDTFLKSPTPETVEGRTEQFAEILKRNPPLQGSFPTEAFMLVEQADALDFEPPEPLAVLPTGTIVQESIEISEEGEVVMEMTVSEVEGVGEGEGHMYVRDIHGGKPLVTLPPFIHRERTDFCTSLVGTFRNDLVKFSALQWTHASLDRVFDGVRIQIDLFDREDNAIGQIRHKADECLKSGAVRHIIARY